MFSIPLNKGDFYESLTALRLALIPSTCSSNRQFEFKITHANTPTSLPRLKNVIFRCHYVILKNSSCTETEQSSLFRVLHFNRQNLMFISPLNDYATIYWHLLKISHWTLKNSMRCAKKQFFVILMTATSGWPTSEMRFLPEQLRWTLLPKERYGNSLSGRGSNTQASNW